METKTVTKPQNQENQPTNSNPAEAPTHLPAIRVGSEGRAHVRPWRIGITTSGSFPFYKASRVYFDFTH